MYLRSRKIAHKCIMIVLKESIIKQILEHNIAMDNSNTMVWY